MIPFRLARVLRLRKEDERIAKVAWAEAVGRARDAATRVEEAREAHRVGLRAQDALQRNAAGGPRSGAAMVQLEHAAESVDALTARIHELEAERMGIAGEAARAKAEYDAARSRAEALTRLEEKHHREQRMRARRREERRLDDVLAARLIAEQTASAKANATSP